MLCIKRELRGREREREKERENSYASDEIFHETLEHKTSKEKIRNMVNHLSSTIRKVLTRV